MTKGELLQFLERLPGLDDDIEIRLPGGYKIAGIHYTFLDEIDEAVLLLFEPPHPQDCMGCRRCLT